MTSKTTRRKRTAQKPATDQPPVEPTNEDIIAVMLRDIDGLTRLQSFQSQLLNRLRRELERLRQSQEAPSS